MTLASKWSSIGHTANEDGILTYTHTLHVGKSKPPKINHEQYAEILLTRVAEKSQKISDMHAAHTQLAGEILVKKRAQIEYYNQAARVASEAKTRRMDEAFAIADAARIAAEEAAAANAVATEEIYTAHADVAEALAYTLATVPAEGYDIGPDTRDLHDPYFEMLLNEQRYWAFYAYGQAIGAQAEAAAKARAEQDEENRLFAAAAIAAASAEGAAAELAASNEVLYQLANL